MSPSSIALSEVRLQQRVGCERDEATTMPQRESIDNQAGTGVKRHVGVSISSNRAYPVFELSQSETLEADSIAIELNCAFPIDFET
jgi:hypothetical protein